MSDVNSLRSQVIDFCARIGTDPLLVQGAGGNVSWKDGDTLWVKASGMWLARAATENIFVPVSVDAMRTAALNGDFAAKPQVLDSGTLRPSIETMLHALMPQRVVVHLHAIDILVHLVRTDWDTDIAAALGSACTWTGVGYQKPGADLASAVSESVAGRAVPVVFLQSHGVVLGGDTVEEVEQLLATLLDRLRVAPAFDHTAMSAAVPAPAEGLVAVPQPVHLLAQAPKLFARLADAWALYPDHVVFLGAAAITFSDRAAFNTWRAQGNALPELVFIAGEGVYAQPGFNLAKQFQLLCYHDVMVRQQPGAALQTLSDQQIGALLNWESEQYRIGMAK
jgi:rhamnose utilization protein RhaD (predicted bifunctional aldolase and dehydrogenase)